jgi:hypothetical protein
MTVPGLGGLGIPIAGLGNVGFVCISDPAGFGGTAGALFCAAPTPGLPNICVMEGGKGFAAPVGGV